EALRAVTPRRPKLSPEAFDLLRARLEDKDQPLARLAAAEILGRCHPTDAQLRAVLKALRGDTLVSPSALIPALHRSPTSATAARLFDYLAESIRSGWRPGEKELAKLLKAFPPEVQKKADELNALLRKSTEGQRARLAEFEPLLAGGTSSKGREVFFGKKV